jgi:orotidine-5'-phosphate decarboxylase
MNATDQLTSVTTSSNLSPELAEARKHLIVALDFPTESEALALVYRLGNLCQWFKVGLELYLSAGNSIVTKLTEKGYSVFLDLKLHDIPNTVAGAVRSATSRGATLITVHTSGGSVMLKAAADAAASSPVTLLGVTVLTSMDAAQLNSVGVSSSPADQVLRLARMATESGLRGFVCSPEEVALLRAALGPEAILVTPGIRPAGAEIGDQKRVATPGAAIAAGATYLVVGRPITQSSDPAAATKSILKDIAAAL